MRLIIASLLLAAGLCAADVPSDYKIIVTRNIFSTERGAPARPKPMTPTVVVAQAPIPAPVATDTATLTGVVIIGSQPTALFAGSSDSLSGPRQLEAKLADLRLTAITTTSVTLTPATGDAITLPVGKSIKRPADQLWQVSEERVATRVAAPAPASTPAAASSTDAATSSETSSDGQSDLLKRLMERRKKELGQ